MPQTANLAILGICGGLRQASFNRASHPLDQPFAGKPGASKGMYETARSQYHVLPVNGPEAMIPAVQSKFDAAGKLTDEPRRGFIGVLIVALRDWIVKLKG
jgi:hypothetical protein